MSNSLLNIIRLRKSAAKSPSMREAISAGQVSGLDVDPIMQQAAQAHTGKMLGAGLITAEEAPSYTERILEEIRKSRPELEELAQQAQTSLQTPVTPGEVAGVAGSGVGLPWAASRLPYVGGKPLSVPQAAKIYFGPAMLPLSGLIEGTMYGLNPLSDPKYQRGDRSYLSSLGSTLANAGTQLGRRGAEARERYGLAGVPIQALHGILNPIASLSYLGATLKDALTGARAPELATQARESVRQSLES